VEAEYPMGWQQEYINAGDFRFIFDSSNEIYNPRPELLSQLHSCLN
jgi:hypothetical protein